MASASPVGDQKLEWLHIGRLRDLENPAGERGMFEVFLERAVLNLLPHSSGFCLNLGVIRAFRCKLHPASLFISHLSLAAPLLIHFQHIAPGDTLRCTSASSSTKEGAARAGRLDEARTALSQMIGATDRYGSVLVLGCRPRRQEGAKP